jgi:hypothetical protein
MKIVILILLIVGMLYALSFAIGSRTGPGGGKDLAQVPSGDWLKSIADRFGPTFDFKTVSGPHASVAQRTFTVPQHQTAVIPVASNNEKKAQRLRISSAMGECKLRYIDNFKPPGDAPSDPLDLDCHDTEKVIAITDQGGTLQISCMGPQSCIIKIK